MSKLKMKEKVWAGIEYIWNHPVILIPFLLILAYLLFKEVNTHAFARQMRCDYLLGEWMNLKSSTVLGRAWSDIVCNGFSWLPGLAGILDPSLGFVRKVVIWAILIFFALMSLLLTITINNIKTFINIITFDRQEWKRLGATLSIFLLIFSVFASIMYFGVVLP